MVRRLIKLHIENSKADEFQSIFRAKMKQIKAQPGCEHLELWQDASDPGLFFTFSIWSDQNAIDDYKKTDLFREIWPTIKKFFSAQPEANTVQQIVTVK